MARAKKRAIRPAIELKRLFSGCLMTWPVFQGEKGPYSFTFPVVVIDEQAFYYPKNSFRPVSKAEITAFLHWANEWLSAYGKKEIRVRFVNGKLAMFKLETEESRCPATITTTS